MLFLRVFQYNSPLTSLYFQLMSKLFCCILLNFIAHKFNAQRDSTFSGTLFLSTFFSLFFKTCYTKCFYLV